MQPPPFLHPTYQRLSQYRHPITDHSRLILVFIFELNVLESREGPLVQCLCQCNVCRVIVNVFDFQALQQLAAVPPHHGRDDRSQSPSFEKDKVKSQTS